MGKLRCNGELIDNGVGVGVVARGEKLTVGGMMSAGPAVSLFRE